MKQTLFILALITATIQTFAQSPRIKLNQITKDSVTGSVLISSPTDSGMVYSRDLFISYGADTVLILNGDTLAATSGIISSVLSDGVTITGDGTVGSPLKVDTATVIATKQDLSDYVTIAGTQTITGAKTFTNTLTQIGGDVNFDSGTLFVDENEDRVGIGTTSPSTPLEISGSINPNPDLLKIKDSNYDGFFTIGSNTTGGFLGQLEGSTDGYDSFGAFYIGSLDDSKDVYSQNRAVTTFQSRQYATLSTKSTPSALENANAFAFDNYNINLMMIKANGDIGIGTTSPSEELEVNGNILASGTITENGSDRKLKTNINPLNSGLDVINNLIPVTYDFIQNTDKKFPIYNQLGFVAQDVQNALSGKSYINGIVIETKDYLALDYKKFIPITVKAIQEQQAIIESQATEIDQLKTLITELSNRLTILENN
jgi:hypothetical protein